MENGAALLKGLWMRSGRNMRRHADSEWAKVEAKLKAALGKLWSLGEMERTGGEPLGRAPHEAASPPPR